MYAIYGKTNTNSLHHLSSHFCKDELERIIELTLWFCRKEIKLISKKGELNKVKQILISNQNDFEYNETFNHIHYKAVEFVMLTLPHPKLLLSDTIKIILKEVILETREIFTCNSLEKAILYINKSNQLGLLNGLKSKLISTHPAL